MNTLWTKTHGYRPSLFLRRTYAILASQEKVVFGPLKNFTPSTELRLTGKKPDEWNSKIQADTISVEQFLIGLEAMEPKHMGYIERYERE
jgi:hypothetical protein